MSATETPSRRSRRLSGGTVEFDMRDAEAVVSSGRKGLRTKDNQRSKMSHGGRKPLGGVNRLKVPTIKPKVTDDLKVVVNEPEVKNFEDFVENDVVVQTSKVAEEPSTPEPTTSESSQEIDAAEKKIASPGKTARRLIFKFFLGAAIAAVLAVAVAVVASNTALRLRLELALGLTGPSSLVYDYHIEWLHREFAA